MARQENQGAGNAVQVNAQRVQAETAEEALMVITAENPVVTVPAQPQSARAANPALVQRQTEVRHAGLRQKAGLVAPDQAEVALRQQTEMVLHH